MSITDTITAPAETTTTDVFAPGRTVWSPEQSCRSTIVSRADGSPDRLHTLAGVTTTLAAIPLPAPGERMRDGAYFLGWANPDDPSDLTALHAAGGGVVRVTGPSATAWDARLHVDPTAAPYDLGTALDLLTHEHHRSHTDASAVDAKVREAREEGRQAATREAQDHLDRLISSAHEWADDHDLCHRFDDFCAEWNLPRREHEWEVEVSLTLRVPVRVTVSGGSGETGDAYEAFRDDFDEDDVWALVRNGEIDPSRVQAHDVTAESVEHL